MIRIVPTLTRRLPPGTEVFGYVRVSADQLGSVPDARLALKRWAVEHRLVLGTVCADTGVQAPLRRPGFHALHRLVSIHRPAGVVMPSLGHLSGYHGEVLGAAVLLRQQGCLLFVVQPSIADIRDAHTTPTLPW
ncbi:hypothetical protein Lesp02_29910 [Lentzea sp. NBRC 105346]|nr:hypothetical protein Lesp02_29910 [Lentzea sp. NBRC 105346]